MSHSYGLSDHCDLNTIGPEAPPLPHMINSDKSTKWNNKFLRVGPPRYDRYIAIIIIGIPNLRNNCLNLQILDDSSLHFLPHAHILIELTMTLYFSLLLVFFQHTNKSSIIVIRLTTKSPTLHGNYRSQAIKIDFSFPCNYKTSKSQPLASHHNFRQSDFISAFTDEN